MIPIIQFLKLIFVCSIFGHHPVQSSGLEQYWEMEDREFKVYGVMKACDRCGLVYCEFKK